MPEKPVPTINARMRMGSDEPPSTTVSGRCSSCDVSVTVMWRNLFLFISARMSSGIARDIRSSRPVNFPSRKPISCMKRISGSETQVAFSR
ncbi:Uncharacterised protein [Mycobacteroides abscessus subsp. abscessus]|nr:Uncharacterised protein [Mycobacteroides abscessus subsp. abscessus]